MVTFFAGQGEGELGGRERAMQQQREREKQVVTKAAARTGTQLRQTGSPHVVPCDGGNEYCQVRTFELKRPLPRHRIGPWPPCNGTHYTKWRRAGNSLRLSPGQLSVAAWCAELRPSSPVNNLKAPTKRTSRYFPVILTHLRKQRQCLFVYSFFKPCNSEQKTKCVRVL